MTYVTSSPNYQIFPVDTFSGDGLTTVFTLSYNVLGNNSILVWVNGLKLTIGQYAVNGDQLTIYIPPSSALQNIEVFYLNVPNNSASLTGGVTSVQLTTSLVGLAIGGTNPITGTGTFSLDLANPGAGIGLGVSSGGTGVRTLTVNQLLLGNGTSGVLSVAPGTSGQALVSGGAGLPPAFGDIVNTFSGASTGLNVSGSVPDTPSSGKLVLQGQLVVNNGGTGRSNLTPNALLYGNDISPVGFITTGPANTVLASTGVSSPPVFKAFGWPDPSFGPGGLMFGAFPAGTNATPGTTVTNVIFTIYGTGSTSDVIIPAGSATYLILGAVNTSEECLVIRTS